ncbi:L-rhamnose-binding lectin CSL2-like [Neoarius graeffei]|uniref:L-rhamnose-binding lectin CSL2-like n=1 Tax=Neoarius graeffei TaxID=443677 RepID=UPI00298D158F|nr:L-rhamnose-binding lectin CSL2-like [Neoarius graeffei]
MILLKLTLLTLLIAAHDRHVSGELIEAPDWDVSGEEMITCDPQRSTCPIIVTCDGGTAVLNCGARRIRILRVFYGRLNRTTCAAGRPIQQICNTRCSSRKAYYTVLARCNKKNYCYVPTSCLADPCYGTYKYLRIAYNCVR